MKLIGLYIHGNTDELLRKSVKSDWYPFVKAEVPSLSTQTFSKYVHASNLFTQTFPKYEATPSSFYKIHESLPEINISAIVGKNGAGKSTLINLLLLTLNNLAFSIFSSYDRIVLDDWHRRKAITFDNRLYSDLYYEQNGKKYHVSCHGNKVDLYEYNDKRERRLIPIYNLSPEQMADTLSTFLSYTLALNFGIYDFNSEDTLDFEQRAKNLHHDIWMDNYFHRVDGYLIPMTLIPSRNQGVININREAELVRQRIAAIDLLLYSNDRDPIIPGYQPRKIKYKINWLLDEEAKIVASRAINFEEDSTKNKKLTDKLFYILKELWEEAFVFPELEETKITTTAKNYLVLKTIKICSNYPQFSSDFYDWNAKIFSRESLASMIKQILADTSHVTNRIHNTLAFLDQSQYMDGAGEIDIEDLIKKGDTFNDIKRKLPPSFFFYELVYSHKNNQDSIRLWDFSSGEKQLLFSLSSVVYHMLNIASIPTDDPNRVAYQHLNIIFDEIELYSHPEYQRTLIQKILDVLSVVNKDQKQIQSINILLSTHSPYILSDIPATNILFMNEENNNYHKTLAANIYDLLRYGFFMKSGIGEFASNQMQAILDLCHKECYEDRKTSYLSKRESIKFFVENIGEPYFYDILSKQIQKLEDEAMTVDKIDEELYRLEKRREQLIRMKNEKG